VAAWAACSICGAVIAAAGFLPAFTVHLEGIVGGGGAQRVYDFDRTYTLAGYGTPTAWVLLGAGVALVVVGVIGVVARRPTLPLLAVAVVALGASAATTTPRFTALDGEGGVQGCSFERGCGGRFLAPAIRDFRRDILRDRRAARQPGFEFLEGYRARQRIGWRVIELFAHLLLLVAALALVAIHPRLAPAPLALVFVALWSGWAYSSAARCGDGASSGSPFGWISAYALGLAFVAALGVLARRRWKWGGAGLAAAVLATPVVFVLGLSGSCSFD
jgi:hypothetical protein